MPGTRQLEILDLLRSRGGALAFEEVARAMPDVSRDQVRHSLALLTEAGAVTLTGRQGKKGLASALVSLTDPDAA